MKTLIFFLYFSQRRLKLFEIFMCENFNKFLKEISIDEKT